jgi:hypothetical protein
MKIVVLGMCCRVSNTIKDLGRKAETSLFEWMRSEKFSDILTIIERIIKREPVEITKRPHFNDDFLHDTDIRTIHYLGRLDEVFIRRSDRFLSNITSSDPILFIREDGPDHLTTHSQINDFIQLLKTVNVNINFKFLLFSDLSQNQIEHVSHHKLPNNKAEYDRIISELESEF